MQVGSGIPGVPGKVGGVSIPVLDREIDILKQKIGEKEKGLSKCNMIVQQPQDEVSNLSNHLRQFEIELEKYGCRN